MKALVSFLLLSLTFTLLPSSASGKYIGSAPFHETKVLLESSKPPKPKCVGFFGTDCTSREAYIRIGRLSDKDVRGIITEYRRFFAPLYALCYQTANFNKSNWDSNCGFNQNRKFIADLFSEPAVIGQGAPVASRTNCIPKYKELLQQAYYNTAVRKNAVKGINNFLNLMKTASYLKEYKLVIPEVVLNGVKNKFSGKPHSALIAIATDRSNWNRVLEINVLAPMDNCV